MGFPLDLGGAHAEEERLLAQACLDDVRILGGCLDEAHVQRVRLSEDHVPPRLEHPPQALPRDEFDLEDAFLRVFHVPAGLPDEVHDLLRIPLRDEFLRHPRVEERDAATEGFLDDPLRDGFDERHHRRVDADLLALDPDGVFASFEARPDLPGVLGPEEDLDLLRPQLVRRAHGVHVDLDVDLHPAPRVRRRDDVELLGSALPDDDLPERAHGIVSELVLRLDRDSSDRPVALDPRSPLRLEARLKGPPEEVDVGAHLLIRDLERARLLRCEDRLLDLPRDFLRRTDRRVRHVLQDLDPLLVAARLDCRAGPGDEVPAPIAREEPSLDEDRHPADRGVLQGTEGDALRVRRVEDLADEVADPDEFRGVPRPLLEPDAKGLVDLLEGLNHEEREEARLSSTDRDDEDRLGTTGPHDRGALEGLPLDSLRAVRERLVHEGLRRGLEGRSTGDVLGRQEHPALVTHHRSRGVEEDRVVDHVAPFRFHADDRRVRRLVLCIVKRTGVVDLEVEVHRARLPGLDPEFQGHLRVRFQQVDGPQALDLDGARDDRGHVLRGPVALVRDVQLEAVPAARLEARVGRFEEEARVAVLQDLLYPRFRGRLRAVDEGLEALQILQADRVLRLLEEQLDVAEIRVHGLRLRDGRLETREILSGPFEDRVPTLAGQGVLRAPQVVLHLAVVLLLDRGLDLREV